MYKVAVVGDYDSIYGFAALGLETFPVSDVKETEKVFLELACWCLRGDLYHRGGGCRD